MNDIAEKCFVCGGPLGNDAGRGYRPCTSCGHEVRTCARAPEFMVNEALCRERIATGDLLDSFKRKTLRAVMKDNGFLLDVGCGSGGFLLRNCILFTQHLGLEVSPQCVEFAREKLGVQVATALPDVVPPVSVATFWHSLEHFSSSGIDALFSRLRPLCSESSRLLIAVPNNNSLLYRFLGRRYPYYDAPNHLHQFSPHSLRLLLKKYGFMPECRFWSFAYSGFAYLQGLLNVCIPTHNLLYRGLRRGQLPDASRTFSLLPLACSVALAIPLLPLSLILCGVDLLWPELGVVIIVSARIAKDGI